MSLKGKFDPNNKFVKTLEDFDRVKKGDTVILSGDLVLMTMDHSIEMSDQFVEQPARRCTFIPQFSKERTGLYAWVSKQALKKADEIGNLRLVLAHDYYMRIGLLKKKSLVLCGGAETEHSLNLEIMVFIKGKLVSCDEHNIEGGMQSHTFKADLGDLLTKIAMDNEGIGIEWHNPLPDVPDVLAEHGIKNVNSFHFWLPAFRQVEGLVQKQSYKDYAFISFVTLFSILTYCGAIYWGWQKYDHQMAEYKTEIQGYEEEFAKGSNNLDLLKKRDKFLSETVPYKERNWFLNNLLAFLATDKSLIVENVKFLMDKKHEGNSRSKMSSRNRNSANDDFVVTINLPSKASLNPFEQISPFMETMSSALGVAVRMDDDVKEKNNPKIQPSLRRIFTIKGVIGKRKAQEEKQS